MAYIYHMVPENMKGKILYPLNVLKKKYPGIYKKEVDKYRNRKKVMRRKIPYLDCFWNDALHFTAIFPSKITKELRTAGYPLEKLKWFKINTNKLKSKKLIVYLYKPKKEESDFMNKDNFEQFKLKNISRYNKIPAKTIRYYKEEIKKDKKPLKFHFIPHILYKDKLNISNAEIIEA